MGRIEWREGKGGGGTINRPTDVEACRSVRAIIAGWLWPADLADSIDRRSRRSGPAYSLARSLTYSLACRTELSGMLPGSALHILNIHTYLHTLLYATLYRCSTPHRYCQPAREGPVSSSHMSRICARRRLDRSTCAVRPSGRPSVSPPQSIVPADTTQFGAIALPSVTSGAMCACMICTYCMYVCLSSPASRAHGRTSV